MKKIGLIGLGRMGYNLALNMIDKNIEVLAYDKFVNEDILKNKQIKIFESVKTLLDALESPKVVWLMVPAGEITDNVIIEVSSLLSKGDILIDGGNSKHQRWHRRCKVWCFFDGWWRQGSCQINRMVI